MGDCGLKSVTGADFCRALQRNGWVLLRIRGSHHVFASADGEKRVSVPVHAGDTLKRGLLASLMRQSGLTEQDL